MKITLEKLKAMKGQEKIAMLTVYSFAEAGFLVAAGVDLLLVGDSLGMVFQGQPNTLAVTVEEMIYHAQAVRRGAPDAFLVVDLPFMSFQVSAEQTLVNAGQIMKAANVNAVKLEGATEIVLDSIRKITAAGIPAMGHLGFTPQGVNCLSGYKVQGKDEESARKLIQDAKQLEKAGVFALVLEMVPAKLAKEITNEIKIPTISCGAGPDCDGQVLVTADIFGLYPKRPKFAKLFKDIGQEMTSAAQEYVKEVKEKKFPGLEHSF